MMTITGGLTSFGISLGAGIVIEGKKLFINSEVKAQIENAFEDSLKLFCRNASVRKKERNKIKKIIEKASKLPSSDLRNEEISGEYSKFFSIFESKLVKYNSAYNYLKEIRDEIRYQEILLEIKTAIETIKDEFKKISFSGLELEYKRQIEQYKSNLESFKPRTAFSNLIALENSFESYEFTPTNYMKSSLESLKGQCLQYMSEHKNEWQKAYIRAFNLNKKSRENLENACYAYFRLDEFKEAEILADTLIGLDKFNSIAWAVKSLIQDNENLCEILNTVPKVVNNDLKFKALIHPRSIEKGTYLDLAEAFTLYNILVDVNEFNGQQTTFENIREIGYLINCAGSKIMSLNIKFNEPIKISLDILTPISEMLKSYLNAIDNSEIEGNHATLKFLISYTQFLIDGEKDSVYRMKEFYTQLESKRTFNTLVLANSLQLIGDINNAIEIITKSEDKSSEILALKLVCYTRLNDNEKFVSTAKQFLKGVTDVTNNLVHMYAIAETLHAFNFNNSISIDEYTKGKSFPDKDSKNLLIEILKVYKDESDSNTVQKLNEIWERKKNKETYVQSSIAESYMLLKEYSKSIEIYKEFLDFEKESIYLLKYIEVLYYSKSNNSKLLEVLKIWRKSFSFHPKILQLEIELKRHLFEWSEILDICEQYFAKDESNEFILANFAIAINEIDDASKEQFKKLFELSEKIEFNSYSNARIAAEVLMQNNYKSMGIELYYRQAIEESNSQARTDYFMACLKCSKEILKNFESIKEGHFVKYQKEKGISYIEITNKNERIKQLIGKNIGDKISYSSKVGNSEKAIIIKRIMNKYLALYDQILEEVDNKGPFSQIAMESINVEQYIKEGNILDFFEELVGRKDYDPDKLINEYYSEKLSFTELVAGEYSNHFIRAYYNLEYDKKGIIQYTTTSYAEINILKYDYFILDFSSLLRFFELNKNRGMIFNKKFTITTSTKSMIKAFSKDFIGYSGNQYILDSKFYKELFEWIDANCDFRMPTSKLDIIHTLPKEVISNPVQGLLIDTIILTQELTNSILITDDSMMLKFYPIKSGKVIGTSSFYLKTIINSIKKNQKYTK